MQLGEAFEVLSNHKYKRMYDAGHPDPLGLYK
jgi:hypothetical protein